MKYRISELLAQQTLDSSGTEIIDIKVKDPISAILFEYKNTRGGRTSADHVAGCLSKIELIDGSDVIFGLSGKQLHALDYYDRKQTPFTYITNSYAAMQMLGMQYNFGRKLWDPMLAFDPTRFNNPQLKITHDKTTCETTSAAHYLRILGFLFDEKVPSPVGFLSSREVMAYTSGDRYSKKYIDLPTDRVMRKLLIYAYSADHSAYLVVTQIKLSEDNDKRVVIDEPWSLFQKAVIGAYPPWREQLDASLDATAIDIYITPSFCLSIGGHTETQSAVVDIQSGVQHSPVEVGASTSTLAKLEAVGYVPHSIIPIFFGDQDDIEDWYDVTKVGSLQAILEAGSAGTSGAVEVYLQQLRRY